MKVCHNFCLSFQNGKSVISIGGKGMALLLHPHSPTVPENQKSNPIQSFSHWLNSSALTLQAGQILYISWVPISVSNAKGVGQC